MSVSPKGVSAASRAQRVLDFVVALEEQIAAHDLLYQLLLAADAQPRNLLQPYCNQDGTE